jgi:hypothetical protein
MEEQLRLIVEEQQAKALSQHADYERTVQAFQACLACKDEEMKQADVQHEKNLVEQASAAEKQRDRLAAEHASLMTELASKHKAALLNARSRAQERMEDLEEQVAALTQRCALRLALST